MEIPFLGLAGVGWLGFVYNLCSMPVPAQSTYEPFTFTTLAGLASGFDGANETGSTARFSGPSSVEVLTVVTQLLPGMVKWEFETLTVGTTRSSSLAIGSDGTVYVGSDDNKVYALDNASGRKKWEFPTEGWMLGSPAIGSDGTVYIGSIDRSVYALNGATGSMKWQFKMGETVYSCPAIGSDGTVYVGSDRGKVCALDGATGQKKWEFRTAIRQITFSPAISGDGTVYFGSGDHKLYALDGITGLKKWEFLTGYLVQSCPAIGSDGTVYFGGLTNAGGWIYGIYALDGATGQKKWEFPTSGGVAYPVIGSDGTVYVGSGLGKVYALDGATGRMKWEFQTKDGVLSAPAIGADGIVYVGTLGIFYALDGVTGQKQWEIPLNTGWYSPTIGSDGTIYVMSSEGIVYALASSSIGGLAQSPWPKLHCNARNTGQIGFAPRIDLDLDSGVMLEGSKTSLGVRIVGEPPPNYQWCLNGEPIPEATTSVYSIASVTSSDAGTYSVIASNACGSVTNKPATLGVNNVVTTNFPGLVLTAPIGVPVEIQSAPSPNGPWSVLADLTLSTSPLVYIDFTIADDIQRFYRTMRITSDNPMDRLEACLCPAWSMSTPVGSQHRIEYVNAQVGFTHWQFLTNLTIPSSPYFFIDTTVTDRWPRFYRTTPLPKDTP